MKKTLPIKFIFSIEDMRNYAGELLQLYDVLAENGEFKRRYPHLNQLIDLIVESNIFDSYKSSEDDMKAEKFRRR